MADGAAYRVTVQEGGVIFTPEPGGARALRERSKQTLLDFQDQTGSSGPEQDQP
ncbi:hypothetical protein ACFSC4_11045 [Deinococcus malanensis]|uniref:hypothetical protein n=1 Tax=Deinococcus malanensis TaxID=1706855 RepID=UPI0036422195